MEIYASFGRFLNRNEKTGISHFTVRTQDNNNHICEGVCMAYPKYTPVKIEYDITENQRWDVKSIRACGFGRIVSSMFLSSDYFSGIKMTTAEKILDSIKTNDVFAYSRQLKETDIPKLAKVPEATVTGLIRKIKNITAFEDLYEYIYHNGGNYYNASRMYKKFGYNARSIINENPYLLIYADADISLCEKMAADRNIPAYDKRRVKAIVEYAMDGERNNGNTRITFESLCRKIRQIEKRAGTQSRTEALFIADEILTESYMYEETDGNSYIYRREDYDNEKSIVSNIRRINASKTALRNKTDIGTVEKLCGVTYFDKQRDAFAVLKNTGIKIITGGPGTGKTTLLNGILKKYEMDNNGKQIFLCAPTGCAARNMSQSTGREALTVHKMLGLRPFEAKNSEQKITKLDADCLVIDEFSMVDTEMFAMILSAVKNGILILLLGDIDQLASIGPGNVLKDLIDSGMIETYKLNHIFRQSSDNPIIANSRNVSKGSCNLITGKSFIIKTFDTEEAMADYAVEIGRKCFKQSIRDVKFYTPSRNRKFRTGTINMNQALQEASGRKGSSITYGYYTFYVGDTILFNRNNYDNGYYNGQEGVITDIQEHNNTQYVTIKTDEGIIHMSGTDIEDIELGYIMTAHKSQGSECRNAVILVPLQPASLLKRQLLYVEITRAKENVIILSEKDALKQAISSQYECERSTGLKEKLVCERI